MATELEELAEFVSHRNEEVRRMAIDGVLGYTVTEEGRRMLKTTDVARRLLRNVGDSSEPISRGAMSCLVNLSTDNEIRSSLIRFNAVDRLMENVRDGDCKHHELNVMLLVNLTQKEEGVRKLLQSENPALLGLHVLRLVSWFCEPAKPALDGSTDDRYAHIASILMNLTMHKQGRQLFLDTNRGIFSKVVPFVLSPNATRAQGILGCVLNLAMDTQNHEFIIKDEHRLLQYLLLPLLSSKSRYDEDDQCGMFADLKTAIASGTAEFNPDEGFRRSIYEIFSHLVKTFVCRERMRYRKVYPVLREIHLLEEGESNQNAIEDVVSIIMLTEEEIAEAEASQKASSLPE